MFLWTIALLHASTLAVRPLDFFLAAWSQRLKIFQKHPDLDHEVRMQMNAMQQVPLHFEVECAQRSEEDDSDTPARGKI